MGEGQGMGAKSRCPEVQSAPTLQKEEEKAGVYPVDFPSESKDSQQASQRARSTPPRPLQLRRRHRWAGSAGGTCCLNYSNPKAEPAGGRGAGLELEAARRRLQGSFTLFFPLGQRTRSGLEPKKKKRGPLARARSGGTRNRKERRPRGP